MAKASQGERESGSANARLVRGWAARLDQRIQKDGTSHRGFAIRADIAHSSLSQFIKGARDPQLDTIVKLSDALGVSIIWLLTGQNVTVIGDKADAECKVRRLNILQVARAEEKAEPVGHIFVAAEQFPERIKAVEAGDDSMVAADGGGICRGDVLLYEPAAQPKPDELIVVRMAGESDAMVRRFLPAYDNKGRMTSARLEASNKLWPTLVMDKSAPGDILGVVRGVMRRF